MSVNPWGEAQAAKLKLREAEKRIQNLESDLLSARILADEVQPLKAELAKYQVPSGSPIPCPACSTVGMFVSPSPLMNFFRVEGAAPIGKPVGVGVICLACSAPVRITQDGAVLAAPKKPVKESPQKDGTDSYQRDLARLK